MLNTAHMKATVVFDSGKGNLLDVASKQHKGNIDIVFTPRQVIADDYIIELLDVEPHKANITIVSSDNGVLHRSQGIGAHTMTTERFVKKLHKRVAKRTIAEEKPTQEHRVDELLTTFEERLRNSSEEE